MGRLTLNVLLSFAQFEREVTSERIRDKIAASKRKGLWVGGTLPFGYEMKDGKIAVVEEEAELVQVMVAVFSRRTVHDQVVRNFTHAVKIANLMTMGMVRVALLAPRAPTLLPVTGNGIFGCRDEAPKI